MKVKITHKVDKKPELMVGIEYELPDRLARFLIGKEWAAQIKEPQKVKVKHGDG